MRFEKDFKFIIDENIKNEMKDCVREAQPNEAFGLIFGDSKQVKVEGGYGYQYQYIGKRFQCIGSDKKSPVAFFVRGDTKELFKIFKEAVETYNMRLLSIFHSHPSGATPSGVDRSNMERLNQKQIGTLRNPFKYQIWSIMDSESAELNGFILLNDELVQVDVKIR
jgi:proteasome lid subunit RPN8/RPN11